MRQMVKIVELILIYTARVAPLAIIRTDCIHYNVSVPIFYVILFLIHIVVLRRVSVRLV